MAKMSVSGIVYTSAFGPRKNHKVDPNDFHWGADFGPPKRNQKGVPLFAIFAGKVTRLRDQYGALGARVGDRQAEAIEYWHLARYADDLGMFVSEGDEVGEMGTTGLSTGIHVHVEHWVKGKRIDPLPFINKQAKKSVAPGDGDTDAPEEDDVALTERQQWVLEELAKRIEQFDADTTRIDELTKRIPRIDATFAGTQDLRARIGVIDGTKTAVDEIFRRGSLDIDEQAVAEAVAARIDVPGITAEQVQQIAAAVADEHLRRLAD